MLSKTLIKAIALGTFFATVACESNHDIGNENIIGLRLDVISSVEGSENTSTLNMFDKTTRRIHTFDLNSMEMLMSTEVQNPKDEHFVIASDDNSFFVDLSAGNLSLYNYNGSKNENFINFLGTPISSAYDRNTRNLVIYDDLNSVALVKITETGQIEKSWVGGPLITDDQSIQAGDVIESGELVLSLIDGSFAIVDLEASMDQRQWVYRLDTSVPHTDVKWIAAVGGSQILYQSSDALVLYDIATSTVLDSNDLPVDNYSSAYSKVKDPHIVYKEKSGFGYSLAYAQAGEIKVRDFINLKEGKLFHQSRLDISGDLWSYIGSGRETEYFSDSSVVSYTISKENRHMVAHRLSDMLAITNEELPEDAYLKRSQDFVFALYPSELGYAEKVNVLNSNVESVRNFNVKYITPDLDKSAKDDESIFFP